MAEPSIEENKPNDNSLPSPNERMRGEILAKHRITRVLPRSQLELREQENNLANLAIQKTLQDIFEEIDKILNDPEQRAKLQGLKQKYNLK